MNLHQLKHFLAAAVLGLAAATPGPALADDTEIYLGSALALGQQVRPNVLFVLDTSASMTLRLDDTNPSSPTRMQEMQKALTQILAKSNNVNVGLMRFTNTGGPVLFPVSAIEGNADQIEGITDANIQRSTEFSSANDAEEIDTGLATQVNTSNETLTLGSLTTATGGINSVSVTTGQNNDVQEQRLSDGSIITGNHINMNSNQINGIRFANVDVPNGAFITSARLVLTAPTTRSGEVTLNFRGELPADGDADPFTSGAGSASNRTTTSAQVSWVNPPAFAQNGTYQSLELSSLIQEIVNDPNWARGQALALIQDTSGPYSGDNERAMYSHDGAGGATNLQPRLEISYALGTPVTGSNTVGLRFEDLAIPQGVTILSASLEFTAREDSNDPTLKARYQISAEKTDDSAAFTAADSDNLSSRGKTSAQVTWDSSSASNPLTEWTQYETYKTPDLTAVVQEVVNQTGWCGNNAMTLLIEDLLTVADESVARKAYSSDFTPTLSDPGPPTNSSVAPVLRINYDYNSVPPAPGGCFEQIVQRQIATKTDDAVEYNNSGQVVLYGTESYLVSYQTNGLRFQDIPVAQGADIVEATLTLNAFSDKSGTSSITWQGQAADDATTFTSTDNNISSRTRTSASVTESLTDWNIGNDYTSTNLAPIVQEIIDRGGWASGNDLAFIQTASTGDRRANTFDGSPYRAPTLRLKVRYDGDDNIPLFKTVRERLTEIVDDLPHQGATPIVGTLYEAARYFRGEGVFHGKNRSYIDRQKRGTRISHASTFTGGNVIYPPGCSDDNLGSTECKFQRIDGDATYISPIDIGCQANYIVLLTDGSANANANEDGVDHGVSRVEALVPGSCADTGSSGQLCGLELTKFLAQEDQRADLSGSQTVKTYTIGFNFSDNWLKQLADVDHGNGDFFTASNASELVEKFDIILADILTRPTSLATPSLSVNAFNKLFHRNEVYFSLFSPSDKVAWDGNVKKYRICDQINITSCTLGEIVDANDAAAIGPDGRILDFSTSVWSSPGDGIEVRSGGASANLPAPYTARSVYTYTGGAVPSNVDLTTDAHTVDGDIADTDLSKDLLGDASMTDQSRLDLIDWIRGHDVDDVDQDAGTIDRYTFEDPLHASPVAVTYGGTEADPVDKLFVATNGGGLRLINAKNGEEEWIFFPQSELAKQAKMRQNPVGEHLYGLDLTPSIWQHDTDGDGIIEAADGDFVRVLQGMRRGGNNLYMIDATPATPLVNPDATTGIDPELLWRIEGGTTTGFENLGQTWSKPTITPILTTVSGSIVKQEVVIFGGGNDPDLDKQFGVSPSNIGNIIYLVDPDDGSLVTSIGGTGTTARHTVTGMDYPIVADLALFDSNGDGATDRLYFGDLGGNVWRIDLKDTLNSAASGATVATVGKLADFSLAEGAASGVHGEDTRKFYSAADVVQVIDAAFSSESRYDLVFIGSGSRPDPLNTDVHDRFFAIRDYVVGALPDVDGNGIADTSCPSNPCGNGESEYPPRTLSDLADLSDNPLQLEVDGSISDQTAYTAATDELRGNGSTGGYGWYLNLQETPGDDSSFIGEKLLSKPVVLAGKLFFTTFTPIINTAQQNSCAISEGTGRLWGLNALTGAALFQDWDNNGSTLSDADRYFELGGGIPSDAVPIFQKKGVTIIVGGGGGATSVDPGITLPRERTYWLQREAN